MKCVVILGFLALTTALPSSNVQVRLAFNNPAGITLTGAGYQPTYTVQQLPQFAAAAPQQQEEQPQQVQAEEPQPLTAEEQQPRQVEQQQLEQEQPQVAPLPYAPPPVIPYNQPQYHQQVAAYGHYGYQQVAPAPVQYASPLAAVAPVAPVQYAAPVAQPLAYGHYQQYQQVAPVAPVAASLAYGHYQQYQQVAPAPVQYASPLAPHLHYAHHAPALAVQQKVGYAHTPVLTKVAGVADVPVTKLAYTQGITQKLVDVAHPAVTTRKVKVRRPALRKEFYDIEHRVIVRPAGSATLELSQPISKVQKGPTVLTPTKFQHLAPVIRYGQSRQIVDGQSGPVPELRSAAPQQQAPQRLAPESLSPRAGPSSAPLPSPPQAPRGRAAQPQQQQQPQFRGDADTEVIESADQPAEPQQQQEQQQPQQQQDQQQEQQQPQEQQQQQQQQEAAPAPEQGRALTITPNMPVELQQRLLELLSARGGTVTEILNEDGKPADSASVLQVADALGDPSLQGGERITTRRIVVTRPIETVQEIEVQEPATKVLQHVVNQPTLFKTAIPAIQRVPVALPAIKHLATPVVKTSYVQPGFAHYAQPAYQHVRY